MPGLLLKPRMLKAAGLLMRPCMHSLALHCMQDGRPSLVAAVSAGAGAARTARTADFISRVFVPTPHPSRRWRWCLAMRLARPIASASATRRLWRRWARPWTASARRWTLRSTRSSSSDAAAVCACAHRAMHLEGEGEGGPNGLRAHAMRSERASCEACAISCIYTWDAPPTHNNAEMLFNQMRTAFGLNSGRVVKGLLAYLKQRGWALLRALLPEDSVPLRKAAGALSARVACAAMRHVQLHNHCLSAGSCTQAGSCTTAASQWPRCNFATCTTTACHT